MEKKMVLALPMLIFYGAVLLSGQVLAKNKPPSGRAIDPIVSTEWLEEKLGGENLFILDIRSPGEYSGGHIPGSINEPFVTGFDPVTGPSSKWIVGKKIGTDEGLWLELPPIHDLFQTIGNLGITKDSRVVIVTASNPGEPPFYGLANGTRVAFTLIYAGVKNVAILDGGYPKWFVEGRGTTQEAPERLRATYEDEANQDILVSIEYVNKNLGKADILDARDADVYFGVTIEPFADKEGHIPTAKSLPAPWIWEPRTGERTGGHDIYYLYREPRTLNRMASGVLHEAAGGKEGKGRENKEIIVYCGVGGYASSWWFVLTHVLGYQNVKLYDGAAQEWVRHHDMVPYQWD